MSISLLESKTPLSTLLVLEYFMTKNQILKKLTSEFQWLLQDHVLKTQMLKDLSMYQQLAQIQILPV